MYLVVLVIANNCIFTAHAQQPYSLVHFDEDVLPQISIGNIQQDQWGYLWMNSQFGIVRFDGEGMRVFTTGNLPGLTSNRVRICAKGADSTIYFVDENHTIIKVKSPGGLEVIPNENGITASGLTLYSAENNNDFTFLQVDKKVGYSRFIDSLNFDMGREILKIYITGRNKGYFFYLDKRGNKRVCSYDGNNYLAKTIKDSVKVQHTFKLNNLVLRQTSVSEAHLFNNAEDNTIVPVTGLPPLYTHKFNEQTAVLFSHESGTFFYAEGNLYRYEIHNNVIVATLIFENLPCNGVTNIMIEKNTGDFLISTKSEGFYKVKRKRFDVINLYDVNKKRSGPDAKIHNNIVYAIAFWDKEHLFASGYRTAINGTTEAQNFFPVDYSHFNLYFLYKPDSSHIWLENNSWIQSLDAQTGSSRSLLKRSNPIKAIALSNGAIILITAHTISALLNNKVTELFKNDKIEITTVEKINENCLAVGAADGLYYFYPAQKKLQRIPYEKELKVRFMLKDKADKLWFTTYGQGLFYLHGTTITPLPVDTKGYLSISHSIVEDNSGYFWITTNHGLFRISYASLLSIINQKAGQLYYTYFDKTDGFNTNEFNGGCSPSGLYQPETGLMFFPSMDGIVKFHPDSFLSVTNRSPIFFDEIILNGSSHLYTITGEPVFDKQTSAIRIIFSSPYYSHGANIKFSYALSSEPEQWKDVDNSRSIVLNNLPGGSYTLTVRKEETDSPPIMASFDFKIEKKFSETILFKLLLLVLVIAVVYLYFKARLFYLNNERKRLEKEVAARTSDQVKLIDQLQNNIAQLTRLQNELAEMVGHKENIIAVLIHDIKSPLKFLNTVADYLDKSVAQNSAEKNKEITGEITQSLNMLYLFTQDFAIWIDSSTSGDMQKWEEANLQIVVAEVLEVYKEIAYTKNIAIIPATNKHTILTDKPMIKSVIRNLVDNAIKNSTNGSITVSSSLNDDTCEIIITDEGRGLSKEQVAELNHYFVSNKESLSFSTAQFGHKIIKDFLKKLGGTITYQINAPAGIRVIVRVPAGKQPR